MKDFTHKKSQIYQFFVSPDLMRPGPFGVYGMGFAYYICSISHIAHNVEFLYVFVTFF